MNLPVVSQTIPSLRLSAVLVIASTAVLAGCAVRPDYPPGVVAPVEQACLDDFRAFDKAVSEHGSPNARLHRVAGFPHLRVTRFYAAFRDDDRLDDDEAFERWVEQLVALGREARAIEWATLPEGGRAEFGEDGLRALHGCAEKLAEGDLAHPERRAALRDAARAADDYSTAKRVVGLYPLTRWGILFGVHRWQRGVQARYTTEPPPDLEGWAWYTPPGAEQTAALEARRLVAGAPRDALGVPRLNDGDWRRLYAAHAPIWLVEEQGGYDRIGAPYWPAPESPRPEVDIAVEPVTYVHRDYTRLDGEVAVQLLYGIWFPERPRTGPLDLLGGHMSGVIFRVTLAADGTPVFYDTVHQCGCYHQFHPTAALEPRARPDYAEPPLILRAPVIDPGQRPVIGMRTRTHYVEHFFALDRVPAGVTEYSYRFADYHGLERLPDGEYGYRSLFGPEGIVPGTERRERWLLWPAGVPSPGAQRQYGRYMTAFVGRRHFDDPDLIPRIFDLREPPGVLEQGGAWPRRR